MTDIARTLETKRPANVLVVGGAGYLGSVLTGQLLERGYTIRMLDCFLFGEKPLAVWGDHPHLEIFRGDVCDMQRVAEALQGIDAVILLAALVGERACDRNPQAAVAVNYLAAVCVAEACAYFGIPRFIFASTDSVYGIQEGILTEESSPNPISLYARLKVLAERRILALASERFAPCVLRMATIYGLSPRMRFDLILNVLTMHAAIKGRCTVYGGKQWRPLVHVADAARAYCLALEAPWEKVCGQVYNVGSNEQNYQIYQLSDLVRQAIPHTAVEITDVPPDLRDYHVTFDKISREFNYRTQYSVIDGVREIYDAIATGRFPDPYLEEYWNA